MSKPVQASASPLSNGTSAGIAAAIAGAAGIASASEEQRLEAIGFSPSVPGKFRENRNGIAGQLSWDPDDYSDDYKQKNGVKVEELGMFSAVAIGEGPGGSTWDGSTAELHEKMAAVQMKMKALVEVQKDPSLLQQPEYKAVIGEV